MSVDKANENIICHLMNAIYMYYVVVYLLCSVKINYFPLPIIKTFIFASLSNTTHLSSVAITRQF